MRWSRGDRSNVEDERSRSGAGLRRGVPIGIGGLLLILILSWLTGTDILSLLDGGGGAGVPPSAQVGGGGPRADLAQGGGDASTSWTP